MDLFGSAQAVIAAKDAEIDRLWKLIETLQAQNIALADVAAARQVNPPAPKPPKDYVPPATMRTPAWIQSSIGNGHIDIGRERERITRKRGPIVEIPDSGSR